MSIKTVLGDLAALHFLDGVDKIRGGENQETKPVDLKEGYRENYIEGEAMKPTLDEIFPDGEISKGLFSESNSFKQYKREIDRELKIFENTPYQLGGLDLEIDMVVNILSHFSSPDVLEIGVANGYSTSFLYFGVQKFGGSITTIDAPRFTDDFPPIQNVKYPLHFAEHICRKRLAYRGKLESTETVGDHQKGGMVIGEKYAGWLVPEDRRQEVDDTTYIGDLYKILPELPCNKEFDLIVLDAVKSYDDRMRSYELVDQHLSPGGICIQDGFWLNPAFEDYANKKGYSNWSAGRIGILRND